MAAQHRQREAGTPLQEKAIMHIVSFEPEYMFISTGELTAMYTARMWGEFEAVDGAGNDLVFHGSEYIQNLSTSWEDAVRKLREMAFDRELPLAMQEEAFPLKTIKERESAGKSAAMVAEIERAKEEQRERDLSKVAEYITAGILLVGKWQGSAVELVDADYVSKLASMADHLDDSDISRWATTCRICKNHLAKQVKSMWVGNDVGDVVEGVFTLTSAKWLENSRYPTCMIKGIMRSNDGNVGKAILYTTRKAMVNGVAGQQYNIKAAVVRHDESAYEPSIDNKVTVIKIIK